MKKKLKILMLTGAFLFTAHAFSQEEQDPNKGITTETEVTTIEVNNGKEVQKLQKEVTIQRQNALMLNQKDKNKVNQDFKVGPTKVTKTTVLKDGDEIVSKEVETYFEQGNETYRLQNKSSKTITRANNKTYTLENDPNNSVCYFTKQGKICVEYTDSTSGLKKTEIYSK